MRDGVRDDLRRIFSAAVSAVDPAQLVSRSMSVVADRVEISPPDGSGSIVLAGPICVFGAGKATAKMTAAFVAGCDGVLDVGGVIVVPEGAEVPTFAGVEVLRGEHPIPGPLGQSSTKRLVEAVEAASEASFVCILSGGASSLLVAPIPPLTLAEKQRVTELLLRSGAAIDEINCVRKHLSSLKGGQMLRLARSRPVLSLLLSDVVGDDPSTIGSGPTVPDRSTFAEAIEVLQARGIYDSSPAAALEILERGVRGKIAETVRPGSPEAGLATPVVLGSNSTACAAAAAAAAQLGYAVELRSRPLRGDTREAAVAWFRSIEQCVHPYPADVFYSGWRDDRSGYRAGQGWPEPGIRLGSGRSGKRASGFRVERWDRRGRRTDR